MELYSSMRISNVDFSKITFVNDRGANFVAGLCEYERLTCQDHILSNCLRSSFEKADALKTVLSESV